MEWKIGDRVVGNGEVSDAYLEGRTGTIIRIDADDPGLAIGVRWDVYDASFHNLDGCCEDGHGWWVDASNISPVISETASETSNPIFHFKAGEDLGEGAWKMMVDEVADGHGATWEDIVQSFVTWEEEFKATGQALPGAYRSAKSVIKGAINNGIQLWTAGGDARGKTAVQKDIKAAKERDKEVKTPAEVIAGKLEKAWKVAVEFNKQEYFHDYVKAHFIEEN